MVYWLVGMSLTGSVDGLEVEHDRARKTVVVAG
jgi:hypothetical protein